MAPKPELRVRRVTGLYGQDFRPRKPPDPVLNAAVGCTVEHVEMCHLC